MKTLKECKIDTVEIIDDFNDDNFNDNYESNDNDYN